ncbi:DNA adenine methylase, partial [candidate division KSB1 bacterium]|nr:DNA adenine methylase [candidate division KSB1 bacterium]
MKHNLSKVKVSLIAGEKLAHLDRNIPPFAHSPMYVWHKFWSRKTWNVVAEYIKTYSREGDIVFDPFSGSGITALEAIKNKRRVIACDLNPIATNILLYTIKTISQTEIFDAFQRIEKKAKHRINELYITRCRKCNHEFPFTCSIWKNSECIEIRYQACPECGDRKEENCQLTNFDRQLLANIEREKIAEWYPKNKLCYPDGKPFIKKEKYDSIDELFTKRNLKALAILMQAIEAEENKNIREILKLSFSSMVHLCSKMTPISKAGHFTPFSSAWIQHSYWYPSGPHMEQNVWQKFDSAVNGPQGIIRAKAETNQFFNKIKVAPSLKKFLDDKYDIFIYTGSCLDLMDKIPDESIDYIFTDPPYDASIQFGELAYLWVSWLRLDENYLENLIANEIVRNERQEKDFTVYHSLLSNSFQKMFKVLKQEKYLTATFHNPTLKVRNATIRAGIFSGFDFEKIHHQELARPSAKSLLQPFGSAQGDFYLRFHKPSFQKKSVQPEEIDELRFERIVIETTTKLLAERAEPTPYTLIINYIDPVLAKHGFFSTLHTGLDIKNVLQKYLNDKLCLVEKTIGGSTGQLWWFKNPAVVEKLKQIPISERVEQTIFRKLMQKGKVTFTEMWEAISIEFPNSLTTDSTSIKDALEIYAKQVKGGFWLLKPPIRQRVNQHSEIIVILALVGKKKGFEIWIGKREQSERDTGVVNKGKILKDYMSIDSLNQIEIANRDAVENIDLLWIAGNEVRTAFEIESTTGMTGALLRGSNLDKDIPKFLVIPEEREAQLQNKMASPLFEQHFQTESWQVLYFDAIRNGYLKDKDKIDLDSFAKRTVNIVKDGFEVCGTKNQIDIFSKDDVEM